jgi:hypothetical protein
MHGIAGSDARNHTDRTRGLNLVDVDHAGLFEDAQVSRFLGFGDETAQVGLSALAEIVLLNGAVSEVEEAETEAELSGGGPLNHAVALQHHEEAVRGALVQLQRRCNLGQTQGNLALAKQIKYSKGTVECLNFICPLRGGVSHFDPLFRL